MLSVVALSEWLRRSGRVSFDVSRKIIHVGVGSWIIPTALLFESRYLAAAGPACFVLLNLVSHRTKFLRAMDTETGDNVGTVLFPLSFVLLLTTMWGMEHGRRDLTAGILALAWGDAAAALFGRAFGRHRYRVGSGYRSLEGSAAMFAFSLLAIWVAGDAVFRDPYPIPAWLAGAAGATLLEAMSRRGADNLLVPAGTAFLLSGLCKLLR